MNIIISGYGRMGKTVEKIARSRNHTIPIVLDKTRDWDALDRTIPGDAVVIDFSQPDEVADNINRCFQHRLPVVVGTTGWNDRMDEFALRCKTEGHALFVASNFSIGVNILFSLNRTLARLMNRFPEYDVAVKELHHIHKVDIPSGTAISLLDQITGLMDRKETWSLNNPSDDQIIAVDALRQGEVFGDHTIKYESASDVLELKHSAKNRDGFALGAVLAAEWLLGKQGFFGMNDLLQLPE